MNDIGEELVLGAELNFCSGMLCGELNCPTLPFYSIKFNLFNVMGAVCVDLRIVLVLGDDGYVLFV